MDQATGVEAPHRVPRLPVLDGRAFARSRERPYLVDHRETLYTNTGRAAIALCIQSLGLGPGDEVLVPTLHCPSMVAPITESGATPRFYPVDAAGVPQIDWLEAQDTRAARLFCVPHYFGVPQPMRRFKSFAQRRGLYLLEDCAHALFGSADGEAIGSWGDFSIASLVKFLPTPDGGLLLRNSAAVRSGSVGSRSSLDEIRAMIDVLELAGRNGRFGILSGFIRMAMRLKRTIRDVQRGPTADPDASAKAGAFELGPVTSATRVTRLLTRYADFDRISSSRRRNYARLLQAFTGLEGAHALFPSIPPDCVPYVFPMYVERADEAHEALKIAGVPIMRWNWLWTGTPAIPGDHGVDLAMHVLQLPCHQALDDQEIDWLCSTIRGVLREASLARRPGDRIEPVSGLAA